MKPVYERLDLVITEFDIEDVITTSGTSSDENVLHELENAYGSYKHFSKSPGSWF